MKNINRLIRSLLRKCIIFLSCLMLFPVYTFSQLSDWKNYTNGDMVTKILNDGDYLWIGLWITYTIDNSDIPSNSILDITVDRDDNLWLATVGRVGVTKFDGTHWESYNVANSGIAFDEVSKITLDYHRGLIWFNHRYSSGLSTAKLNSNTGIDNIRLPKDTKGFTAYLNPSGTSITVRLQGIDMGTIHVYDISGTLIASCNEYQGLATEI